MISIRHVYQTFGSRQILKDVSLTVKDGETMVILGASGSGKSTLLKLIIGLLKPTSGEVMVNGKDMARLSEAELNHERRHMGFVFQYSALFDSMTVKENVDLIRDVVKNAKDSTEILNKVGLNGQENKFPNQLSGGEQQRVSIARAIAKNPKLLLCDEPTGALDSNTGVEILKLLRECTRENTVVIVTHNALIADVADRVIRLKNGKIIENVVNAQPKNINEVNW